MKWGEFVGLKETLINRLKRHNGQLFEITFKTSKGFSSHSRIECGDVYIREEIKNLDEEGVYFLDDVINIVDRDTMLSFILKDEGIISVKDKDNPYITEDQGWLDKFDIEYDSGITICIDVFKYDVLDGDTDDEEAPIEQFNRDEYLKELLLRNYFEKDNETLINVLTTLKSLEGKDLVIEHSSNIVCYKFYIHGMVLEEVIGEAIFTGGIELRDFYNYHGICINEEKIVSFKTIDNFLDEEATTRYEIKFDDGSLTVIEVCNDDDGEGSLSCILVLNDN